MPKATRGSVFSKAKPGAIVSVLKIAVAMVLNKLAAVIGGPAGVAFVGELQNVLTIIFNTSQGGISSGVVSKIAAKAYSNKQRGNIVNAGAQLVLAFSLASSLALSILYICGLPFLSQFSDFILYLIFFIPFYGINFYIISVKNGYSEMREWTRINLYNQGVLIISATSLGYLFGISGLAYALIMYIPVSLVFLNWKMLADLALSIRFQLINRSYYKSLLLYSFMALTSILVSNGTLLYLRNSISVDYSVEMAGLWQAVNSLSAAGNMLFYSIISTFMIPEMAKGGHSATHAKLITRVAFRLIPLLLLGFIIIEYYSSEIVIVLFSDEFSKAGGYLKIQYVGDVFRVFGALFAIYFVARGLVGVFAFLEVFFGILSCVIYEILRETGNTEPFITNYVINAFLYCLVSASVFVRLKRGFSK